MLATRNISIRMLAPLLLMLPVVLMSIVILLIVSRAAARSAERQADVEQLRIQV